MKKVICLLLCFVLAFSVSVSAAKLDFLRNNATYDYAAAQEMQIELKVPMTFVEELLATELEALETHVDLRAVLEGLVEQSQTAKVAAKISDDYKKIEMSMEAETVNDLAVNANLDVSIQSRNGIWVHMDLSDASQPVFEIIYTKPELNKYVVLDVFAFTAETEGPEASAELYETLDYLFSREVLKPFIDRCCAALEKYATVTVENRVYTLHLDSVAFSKYLAEVFNEIIDLLALIGQIEPAVADEEKMNVLLNVPGLDLLGKDGCTIVYSVTQKGVIQKTKLHLDVEMSLRDVLFVLMPDFEEWPIESEGLIAFTLTAQQHLLLGGESVTVTYPDITEENSISHMELEGIGIYEDMPFDEFTIPYVSVYTDFLPKVGDEIYVPLRAVFESAYGDAVSITFTEDERLIIESAYFDTIYTRIGGDSVRINDEAFVVGDIIMRNDTTYVSSAFFEFLFGWSLVEASYDMLYDYYYASFYIGEE